MLRYSRIDGDPLKTTRKKNLLSVNWSAIMLCAEMIGATSLSLPQALQKLGLFIGLVLYAMVMIVSYLFANYLGQTYAFHRDSIKEELNLQHLRDPYPQVAQRSVGTKTKLIVIFSILLSDFLGVAVLIMLPAYMLVESFEIKVSEAHSNNFNRRLWVLFTVLFITPLCWNDRPKDNKLVGFLAFIAAVIGHFAVVMLYGLAYKLIDVKVENKNDTNMMWILISLGVMLTCADGFDILPTLQEDMVNCRDYKKVLIRGYVLFNIFILPIMIGGYVLFGKHKISDNILVELHKFTKLTGGGTFGKFYQILLSISLVMFILQILMSIVVQLNPSFQYLEKVFKCREGFCWERCLLRSVFIGFVLVFSEFAPALIPIMSSHGAILFVILGVSIPGIMYLRTFKENGVGKRILIVVVIIAFLVYLVFNTMYTMIKIMKVVKKEI